MESLRQSTVSKDGTGNQLDEILQGRSYGDIYVNGMNARVQLGDNFLLRNDLFNTGTAEERRAALLNLLYYDGFDLKRAQLQRADVHLSSFSWIEHTEFRQWLQSGKTPFWINGKPGSGKSTLMKYLAESRQTHQLLNCGMQKWKIVPFFFDYRAAKSLANNLLGMLKNFLSQLCKIVPDVENHLSKYHNEFSSGNHDFYVETICNLIEILDLNICAFIDGLDEYDGDLWELCTQLEMLRDRTGMRMCLASRPERAFEEFYGKFPSVTMQKYNDSTIRVLIERKIAKFIAEHPLMSDSFSTFISEAVLEKAAGVILWARLVIDEMIKNCTHETTSQDLLHFLELLPPELEPLYQRLLEKINPKYLQQSAVILYLLVSEGCPSRAKQLYQALNYLEVYALCSRSTEDVIEIGAYEIQVKSLLGNMVDIYQDETEVVFGLDLWCIRLLHRSLSMYLNRTCWLSAHLPVCLQQRYPNRVWRRIAVEALAQAASEDICRPDELGKSLTERLKTTMPFSQETTTRELDETIGLVKDYSTRFKLPHFGSDAIRFTCKPWQSRLDLLYNFIRDDLVVDDTLNTEFEPVVDSLNLLVSYPNLSSVHFMSCRICQNLPSSWWHWIRVSRLYNANALHLVVKLAHSYRRAIVHEFERHHISGRNSVFEDLWDLILMQPGRLDIGISGLNRLESDEHDLIKCFHDHGYLLDTRHLCAVHITNDRYSSSKFAWVLHSNLRHRSDWSSTHDRDCPYSATGTSVLRHWFLLCCRETSRYDPELFLEAASPPNDSISLNGKSEFHQIIELWNHIPSHLRSEDGFTSKSVEDFLLDKLPFMFKVIARHGVLPLVKGSRNNDLIYARSQWRLLKFQKFAFWRAEGEGLFARKPRLKFLSRTIQALKEYKKHAEWPDLDMIFPKPP